jgi:hypothetical protein
MAQTKKPVAKVKTQPLASELVSGSRKQGKGKRLLRLIRRNWVRVSGVVIVIVVIGSLTYGYIHTRNQLRDAANPKTAGKTEIQQITNVVGKSVELPSGETPTLATVSDVTKLKTQAFFKDAQNNDKVLIYSRAGKALLYRPSTKKIITYSPVNMNGQ